MCVKERESGRGECIIEMFLHFQSSLSVQLQYKLPSLLSQQAVKLIVVDSMAALFRVEFTASQTAQRAHLLRAFGAQLRRLSNEYNAAVVCVNQVSCRVWDYTCTSGSVFGSKYIEVRD